MNLLKQLSETQSLKFTIINNISINIVLIQTSKLYVSSVHLSCFLLFFSFGCDRRHVIRLKYIHYLGIYKYVHR
jgi:hypothetical protein